jgi:hypothetical protein
MITDESTSSKQHSPAASSSPVVLGAGTDDSADGGLVSITHRSSRSSCTHIKVNVSKNVQLRTLLVDGM